jgi:hypothetical protein
MHTTCRRNAAVPPGSFIHRGFPVDILTLLLYEVDGDSTACFTAWLLEDQRGCIWWGGGNLIFAANFPAIR